MMAVGTRSAGATESGDLAAMLLSEARTVHEFPPSVWGFGGLHGGLALSLVAAVVQQGTPDRPLRSITGQLHRPMREHLTIESQVVRAGRSVSVVTSTARNSAEVCLSATAILGSDQTPVTPVRAPAAPDVPGPHQLKELRGIADWVPVLGQVDVRPVGSIEPYGLAGEPVMTAWMRMKEREEPVRPPGVVFFLDALPPSFTAVLAQQRPVPTVECSVHLTSRAPTSPWVLVRSRTDRADEGGWVTETVEAWDPQGTHLGSARQLRLVAEPV